MIEAAVFDLDGLMINSEPLQSKAFERVVENHGGKPDIRDGELIHVVGINVRDNLEILIGKFGLIASVEELMTERALVYSELIREGVVPMPGLMALLALLETKAIPLAVASSSMMDDIEAVLEGLGIRDKFRVIVSGQSVERGKPDPEIYLKAAEGLGIDPKSCLALEDSGLGVDAAHAAGINAVGVLSEYTQNDDFSRADAVVDSLEQVTWELICSLW